MSEVICPHCFELILYKKNLKRHLKDYCPVLKASQAMADLRVGRGDERDTEKQRNRKSSRSRERGGQLEDDDAELGEEESEAQVFFKSTYPRLLKAPDPVKVFEGADPAVQNLLTEKFFKERQNFIREKEIFEAKERDFQHLDGVFQKILLAQQVTASTTTATATASTTAPTTSTGFGFFGTR
jgi:hypothetical protein